jgi:hypothetical protein
MIADCAYADSADAIATMPATKESSILFIAASSFSIARWKGQRAIA